MTNTMPHRALLAHTVETLSWAATFICSGITALLLAVTRQPDYEELRNLLVPLISGAFFCCGVMAFNPEPETRRIVVGRFLIALPLGCTVPSLVSMYKPEWHFITDHAIILLPAGGLSTAVCYILSYPIFRGAYRRSKAAAETILDSAEKVARIQRKEDVKEAVHEAVNEPPVKETLKEVTKEAIKEANP